MRLANVNNRPTIVNRDCTAGIDVPTASEGAFISFEDVYSSWDSFVAWAKVQKTPFSLTPHPTELGPPSPRPRQVFAVGLNYIDHAKEGGYGLPTVPTIFTKFQSCLTGPFSSVVVPPGRVDWEVELVAVLARETRCIDETKAWGAVAGVTIGQDISERDTQHRPPAPQFSLGKSHPGFGPFGPSIVTLDEIKDVGALELTCRVNGEIMQQGLAREMIFDLPKLVSYLSQIVTLYPGDVIFTGTPPGVGHARKPPRFLKPGDVLESDISGIGIMRQMMVAAAG